MSVPAPPAPPASGPPVEQYKAYLQDVGNIGTRYTTSNGFYLSVITALLGILTLMKPGEGLADLQLILRIAVPIFAIGLCFVWRHTLLFYSAIFKAKFDVLREIEKTYGLFPAYSRERDVFTGKTWLLENEALIPICLALPFVVILANSIWAWVHHA
jgi:hypothetical protein